jgi:hypothetical protein
LSGEEVLPAGDLLPVDDFAPARDLSVEEGVPAGELLGEEVVPAGVSAGVEVVPAGVSAGVEPPPVPPAPPPASLPPWQAARDVIKPTRIRTIAFDFTVNILTSYNFRHLSYPYSKSAFQGISQGKDFLAYFLPIKSYIAIPLPRSSEILDE